MWEELYEVVEILVVNALLATEVVLDGDSKRLDEINDGLLLKESHRPSLFFAGGLSWNLGHHICETRGQAGGCSVTLNSAHTWYMKPYDASKCPAAKDDRRPVLTTFVVPFEAGGGAVRDDETEDSTQSKLNIFSELDSLTRVKGLTPSTR